MSNPNLPQRPVRPTASPQPSQPAAPNTGFGYETFPVSSPQPQMLPAPAPDQQPVFVDSMVQPEAGSTPSPPPPPPPTTQVSYTQPSSSSPKGSSKKTWIIVGSVVGGLILLTGFGLIAVGLLGNVLQGSDETSDTDVFEEYGLDAPLIPVGDAIEAPADGYTDSDMSFANGKTVTDIFGTPELSWGVDAVAWTEHTTVTPSGAGVTAWEGVVPGTFENCSLELSAVYAPMEGVADNDLDSTVFMMSQLVSQAGLTETTELHSTWVNAGFAGESQMEVLWISGVSPQGNGVVSVGRAIENMFYSQLLVCSLPQAETAELTAPLLDNNTLYPPF